MKIGIIRDGVLLLTALARAGFGPKSMSKNKSKAKRERKNKGDTCEQNYQRY
jgi:hypothetical protein